MPLSHAKYETVFRTMSEGVVVIDAAGQVVDVNPAALRMHGWTTRDEALLALPALDQVFECFDLDGAPVPVADWPIARALRGETVREAELVMRRRDGGADDWIGSYNAAPVLDGDGRVAMVVLTMRDVTAQKRNEAEKARLRRELALEQARLLAVLEALPSGVSIAAAPSGRLLYHNAEAVRLLGHPLLEADDITGYAGYGALHDDGKPYDPAEYPIARALKGEITHQEEMRYRRGDGRLTTFAVNAAPVRDENGVVVYAVSTFHDIAHRKRIEADLTEALAERDALAERRRLLLDEMNHRIKNNLSLVAGLIVLQSQHVKDPDAQAVLAQMRARIHTVADIHEHLYRHGQVETVEFGAYLRGLCKDLERSFAVDSDGVLTVDAAEAHMPTARAISLALIATELATNAFKYAAGAPVRVALEQAADGDLILTVEDGGPGLPPDFDPEARHGMGMRLIVMLTRQLGGGLEHGGGGRGARLRVRVPANEPTAQESVA